MSTLKHRVMHQGNRLGVGLYHSARQAAQLGYRVALAVNEPGTVCFVLTLSDGSGRA